jgi:hypothetical protein
MAIVLDQALGTNLGDPGATTIVLTTTNAVAAGGFIVLGVAAFSGGASFLTSVTGGGLTWSIDKMVDDASRSFAIVSAQAPAGLASSTALTANLNASLNARIIGGTSFTGVKTSPAAPVDGTPTGPTSVGTGAWATASYAIAAGSIIAAMNYSITLDSAAVNTATGPSVEAWERSQTADNYGACAEYRIEASAASYTVAGTWSGAGTTGSANCAVAYLAAPTGVDTGLAWIRA